MQTVVYTLVVCICMPTLLPSHQMCVLCVITSHKQPPRQKHKLPLCSPCLLIQMLYSWDRWSTGWDSIITLFLPKVDPTSCFISSVETSWVFFTLRASIRALKKTHILMAEVIVFRLSLKRGGNSPLFICRSKLWLELFSITYLIDAREQYSSGAIWVSGFSLYYSWKREEKDCACVCAQDLHRF